MSDKKDYKRSCIGCLGIIIIFSVLVVLCTGNEEPLTPEEQSKKNIDDQFSPSDGMHFMLSYYIEDRLNDPESFEHVKTTYKEEDDHLLVYMEYRATNAFNAKILKAVIARVSKEDGRVLEIVKSE
ncbi:hypothetical protein DN752_19660 [Echinicola strongylocentroti]|uniref:Uncharacterized protein n=1 Tax=Echinicola strongylocentroti TaxID=1795355 RepID=A0A2Z4INE6_9BACT|nr:hypothetical protein [Echinicola strongylocentroti]AWW32178.1 hypothetical protein DN752_19660 [Echinicola strongylocentroti]